jgi:hypothetical protein
MSKLELLMAGAEATTSLWKQQLHTRAMSKATIVMKEGRGRSAFRNPDAPTVSPSVPIVSTVSEGIDLSVMSIVISQENAVIEEAPSANNSTIESVSAFDKQSGTGMSLRAEIRKSFVRANFTDRRRSHRNEDQQGSWPAMVGR